MTKVINKNKESYDVYIGRGSIFGNPFTHLPLKNTHAREQVSSREEAIERYEEYFFNRLEHDEEFLIEVLKLKDKTLGCYCKPKSCHGDVISEFLNKL